LHTIIVCTKAVWMWSMWVSTECQWFLVLHIWQSMGGIDTYCESESIGGRYSESDKWHAGCHILQLSVIGASMILGLPLSFIMRLCGDIDLWSNYRPRFLAKMLLATSYLFPENEGQLGVNDLRLSIFVNRGAIGWHWPMMESSAPFLGNNAFGVIVPMPWKWASTDHQLS